MGLRFTILATAAILLPVAAGAQQAQPDAGTAAQPATAAPPANSQAQTVKPATKEEVKAGAAVFDSSGASVGKIDSVDAKGAVLDTGKVKVTIPLSSLAHGDKGLVISMTKDEIEAAAKKPD